MTQPTIAELNKIDKLDPKSRAAMEFVWAFTEWWEDTAEDLQGKVAVNTDLGLAMEQAYERWFKLR